MQFDPLETITTKEGFLELIKKAETQWDRLEAVFFPGTELQIWLRRQRDNEPIRSLAMTFHMSRYNIRKTLSRVEKKIDMLRLLFTL